MPENEKQPARPVDVYCDHKNDLIIKDLAVSFAVSDDVISLKSDDLDR